MYSPQHMCNLRQVGGFSCAVEPRAERSVVYAEQCKNNSDHRTPIFAKKYACKIFHTTGIRMAYSPYRPKNVAYRPPLSCRTVFIGGGGGLQFVENNVTMSWVSSSPEVRRSRRQEACLWRSFVAMKEPLVGYF